ncbi:MAG: EamA family transporter [Steroidobacter sp.]|nr:EamA family transporter [Steroidobacter sp.]MBL8272128.1 EamA family transporter [Steroidobacter sp.]
MRSATVAAPVANAWLTPAELLLLGAVWGSSFLFMRIAAKDFGAFALVEVRLALGALILLPFLFRVKDRLTRSHWLRFLGIGIINSAAPFALFAWAAQRAPAGVVAISNATVVMFTSIVAFLVFGEKISKRSALGLLLGFVGVAVLASGKTSGGSVLPAAMAGVCASILYAFGGNFSKRYFPDLPPSAVAAGTVLCASLVVAPLAIATWPSTPIPALSWLSAVMLGALCTGLAYFLYYRLLYRIGAPRASTVTYLVPLFGVIWAWVFLNEPLTISMASAGALILGGVALSQQRAPAPKP